VQHVAAPPGLQAVAQRAQRAQQAQDAEHGQQDRHLVLANLEVRRQLLRERLEQAAQCRQRLDGCVAASTCLFGVPAVRNLATICSIVCCLSTSCRGLLRLVQGIHSGPCAAGSSPAAAAEGRAAGGATRHCP
jgi:hypothetical protein